jgi:Helix-turn-helix domain
MTDVDPRYAWRNAIFASTLLSRERLVALAWEQFMNGKSGCAWPSKSTLALATGLSTRTVQSALHGLVRAGWLEIAAPESQHRPVMYTALLRGEKFASLRLSQGSNSRPPGEQISTARGANSAPEPLEGTSREPLTTRAGARERKKARRGRASKSTEQEWKGVEAYDR